MPRAISDVMSLDEVRQCVGQLPPRPGSRASLTSRLPKRATVGVSPRPDGWWILAAIAFTWWRRVTDRRRRHHTGARRQRPEWLGMLDGAAAEAHVCVYDRAGIGWSDAPPRGRHTPGTMASDLHALLQAADIPSPYIVIGHSLGGVIGRRFQADYPQLVAGMLLIDSAHEDHARRLGALDWREGPLGILRRRHGRRRGFSVRGAWLSPSGWRQASTRTLPARLLPNTPERRAPSGCQHARSTR